MLYSFDRSKNIGSSPEGPVVFDSAGNIYGTTAFGGDLNCQGGFGCGVVYELSPPAEKEEPGAILPYMPSKGATTVSIPAGYMVFDSAGNLYGTTEAGGEARWRHSLSPEPAGGGGAWTETVLHGFTWRQRDPSCPTA